MRIKTTTIHNIKEKEAKKKIGIHITYSQRRKRDTRKEAEKMWMGS